MLGLGYLAQDLLGSGTLVFGLGCTQTASPSLFVQIAPGRIYSLQNVDNTAYSSLAADTVDSVVKQGILLAATTLAIAPPSTPGQSINYLIEAAFSEVDTTQIVLPYYNVANPTQMYAGPNNSNVPQATARAGTISFVAKAGTAAATGTQTTPAVDTGYVGLYVVTIAYGATTVVNGNIAQLNAAPFMDSSFQGAWTGFSAAPSATTVLYTKNRNQVTVAVPTGTGTSNSTGFTLTGLPAFLQPTHGQVMPASCLVDNGNTVSTGAAIVNGGTIYFCKSQADASTADWTATGNKGINATFAGFLSLSYLLN